MRQLSPRTIVNHTLFGIVFGLTFPVIALLLEWYRLKSLPLDPAVLIANNPVIGIVMLAPFVLGFVFHLVGDSKQKVITQLSALEKAHESYLVAHRDALTDVGSRHAFSSNLRRIIQDNAGGRTAARIILIDLDRFKLINDTLGHQIGDALLIEFARRLSGFLSPRQSLYRMGGDEFVIIDQDPCEDDEGEGNRILSVFDQPFDANGTCLFMGGSLGISHVRADDETEMAVIGRADLALYRAKAVMGNCCAVFDDAMAQEAADQVQLERDLRRGIQSGEFILEYQPIVSVDSNVVRSFEALVRWNHPIYGRVGPDRFIPLAEVTGLIIPLGTFVLGEACKAAMTWPDTITVSVNVSIHQFLQREFYGIVCQALKDAGLPANRLTLEITETVFTSDLDVVGNTIDRLRDLGVRFALDDFGTGYSSLTHLREFHLDYLKLDRSFITRLKSDAQEAGIIRAVVDLGRQLNLSTTVEGVEEMRELDAMRGFGIAGAQGYHFARPMPVEAIEGYLRQQVATPPPAAAKAAGFLQVVRS